MQMPFNFEELKKKYSEFSDLELHFFNLKHCGIKDDLLEERVSRPIFELWDEDHLVEIDFLVSEKDSPYGVKGNKIFFRGKELKVNNILLDRFNLDMPYFYVRGPLGGKKACPTLNDMNLLNINHHQRCTGCDFCAYGERQFNKENRFAKDVLKEACKKHKLSDFQQVAFVTGCFNSEEEVFNSLLETIVTSKEQGFNGNFLYIGFQITKEKLLERLISEIGSPKKFEYVYTIERFTNRKDIMHGPKGKKDINEIIEVIKSLHPLNLGRLQYTYLVGIENLLDFKKHAYKLVPFATPHISIFRKSGLKANEKCFCKDYLSMGAAYICEIRKHFEKLYGHNILGNNLANLWLFPRDKVSEFLNRLIINKKLEG